MSSAARLALVPPFRILKLACDKETQILTREPLKAKQDSWIPCEAKLRCERHLRRVGVAIARNDAEPGLVALAPRTTGGAAEDLNFCLVEFRD